MKDFDDLFYTYIQVLMESFGGSKANIDLPDGSRVAGIIWEGKRWDRKNKLVNAEKNEPNKIIETE